MIPGAKPASTHPWGDEETPFLQIGEEMGVRSLVESFYDVIEAESPRLREMLPRDTFGSRQKLYEYLCGWLGGPPLYTEKRGHPRLRIRHLPFTIGAPEAAEWMQCMNKALKRQSFDPTLGKYLIEKFDPLAIHMINQ